MMKLSSFGTSFDSSILFLNYNGAVFLPQSFFLSLYNVLTHLENALQHARPSTPHHKIIELSQTSGEKRCFVCH